MDELEKVKAELASLKMRLEDAYKESQSLKSELAEVNGESARRKSKIQRLAEELNTKTDEIGKVRSERDQELEATKSKLREVNHRGVFDKLAKTHGANDQALNDLYAVSGYKPEADDVDEESLSALVQQTLESKPYFKAQEASKPAALNPGQGNSRGSVSAPSSHVFRESEMRNVLVGPRKAEFVKASKDKTLTVVPD